MLEKIRGEGGRESLWYYASKRKKKNQYSYCSSQESQKEGRAVPASQG